MGLRFCHKMSRRLVRTYCFRTGSELYISNLCFSSWKGEETQGLWQSWSHFRADWEWFWSAQFHPLICRGLSWPISEKDSAFHPTYNLVRTVRNSTTCDGDSAYALQNLSSQWLFSSFEEEYRRSSISTSCDLDSDILTCFKVFLELGVGNLVKALKFAVFFTFLLNGIVCQMNILVFQIFESEFLTGGA